MADFPARIHVLLASHSQVGLVIRRGPSKHVATFLWDRSNDEFHVGQWLKGRIYERRSDLSPDGKYFIYFAMNGKWKSEAKGSWTAISRAPYLKAVALFPKGDCWHGGGLWTSNTNYWLNGGYDPSLVRDTNEVRRDDMFTPSVCYGGECLGVYYPRLLRDGWRLSHRIEVARWKRYDVFHKELKYGWSLRKIAHAEVDSPDGKGCYWDEHLLVHAESKAEIACPQWEWAELDNERLVWACHGKLFAGVVTPDGVADETELFDFTPMKFKAIQAPYGTG